MLACAGEECGLWSDELQFSYIEGGPVKPRFTDNGDGTVTDNKTTLMWMKNANPSGQMEWGDAITHCQKIRFAGYGDWRLPSISELMSLTDKSQRNPALPPGNPFTNVQLDFYWSITGLKGEQGFAWSVDFIYGLPSYDTITCYEYIWIVRTGN